MTQTWGDDIRDAENALAASTRERDDLIRRAKEGDTSVTRDAIRDQQDQVDYDEIMRQGAIQRAAAARYSGALDNAHAVHAAALDLLDEQDAELARLAAAHHATGVALYTYATSRDQKARDIIRDGAHVRDQLDQLGEGNGREVMRKRIGLTVGHDGIVVYGDPAKRLRTVEPVHILAAIVELVADPAEGGRVLSAPRAGQVLAAIPAAAEALGLDPAQAHTAGNLADPGRAKVTAALRERTGNGNHPHA